MSDPFELGIHMEHQHDHNHDDNPLQPYFDWQVTTIMLAHDLVDPIEEDQAEAERRRADVEREVSQMVLNSVPDVYKNDPELSWPPDMLRNITKLTLERAYEILKSDQTG